MQSVIVDEADPVEDLVQSVIVDEADSVEDLVLCVFERGEAAFVGELALGSTHASAIASSYASPFEPTDGPIANRTPAATNCCSLGECVDDRGLVNVSVHSQHGRPERTQLVQRCHRDDVAGMHERVA